MSRLTRDGTAEPISRDQIHRHSRGQGNINFPCSADHEQDWQPYPVDPYSAICHDHTCIHTYIHTYIHTLNAIQGQQTKTKGKYSEYIHVFDLHIFWRQSTPFGVSLTYQPGFGKEKKCTV